MSFLLISFPNSEKENRFVQIFNNLSDALREAIPTPIAQIIFRAKARAIDERENILVMEEIDLSRVLCRAAILIMETCSQGSVKPEYRNEYTRELLARYRAGQPALSKTDFWWFKDDGKYDNFSAYEMFILNQLLPSWYASPIDLVFHFMRSKVCEDSFENYKGYRDEILRMIEEEIDKRIEDSRRIPNIAFISRQHEQRCP